MRVVSILNKKPITNDKQASIGDIAMSAGKHIILPLGLAAASAAIVHKVNKHFDKAPKVSQEDMDAVTSHEPNLKSVDPKLLGTYYGLLKREAPRIMSDHLVAATTLKKVVNYGGIDHVFLEGISKAEQTLKKPSSDRLAAATSLFNASSSLSKGMFQD